MFSVKNVVFVKSMAAAGDAPSDRLPHCCFVGRSNAGKSSMINALLNRKGIARTGKLPGRTRLVNFFKVNDNLYFVDLPGYGFSAAPANETLGWRSLIESYLRDTPNRKLVFLLIDSRRKPTEDDVALVKWLRHFRVPIQIIAAKSDQTSRNHMPLTLKHLTSLLDLNEPPIPFSSKSKEGLSDILKVIEQWAA